MIIYPPLIEELVPAFLYHDTTTSEGAAATTIFIPFEWNPAVPKSSNITLKLQIKDYFTSTVIYTSTTGVNGLSGTAVFVVPDTDYIVNNKTYTFPIVGQYYKLQIAYDDGDTSILTYSSASLGKCISSNITMYISDMQETDTGNTMMENCVDYKGIYLRDQLNEPLYSYRFDFKDQFGNILESSGEIVWDNEQDKQIISPTLSNELNNCFQHYLSSSLTSPIDSPFVLSIQFFDNDPSNPTIEANFIDEININFGLITQSQLYSSNIIQITLPPGKYYLITNDSWGNYNNALWSDITITENYCGYFNTNFILREEQNVNGLLTWELSSEFVPIVFFKSSPIYHLNYEPQIGQTYTMDFTITTINGYSKTVSRQVQKQLSEAPLYKFNLVAKADKYDGYIELSLNNLPDSGMNAQFSIERSTIEKQNSNWETITTFAVGTSANLSTWSWRDFSAELGTDYIYRIRQFNKGQYSTPISFAYATLPVEHMFLSDGEKQLKIAFNPKVSSFKTTTLETKTDTIGGKYPIFYRNGQVGYKEIPISGLISYQMDDNQFFMTDDELGLNSETIIKEDTAAADSSIKGRTTNLVDYNILAERKFKLAVLDWLNNGKPKLFRSGPEGNYIVRLMNVSLSPNDTVGRMLHTFSCTGYEIAECTFDKLKELNLINIDTLVPDGVDYTTEQYLGSGEGLTKYYIRNLSWSTLTPVLYSKIQLKPVGSENYLYFINATGLFETPKDVVYEELIIPANNISDKNAKDYNELANSTFNYEIDSGTYDSATDTFGTTKTTVVWEKAAVKSYSNVYYLSAVIETPDKNSYIKLNDDDKPIDLSDGQTRYYYDLGNVTISAIVNASVIIAYGKQEATS